MNKLLWRQIVLLCVLLVLMISHWLLRGRANLDLTLLWWWLGAILGFLFVFADRFIYAIGDSDGVLSLKLKDLSGKWRTVPSQGKLMMKSVLFVVVWAVLAIFTATSSANPFARGLMLGLGTHLVFDLFWDYSGKGREFGLWFWQIKKINRREMDIFAWGSFVFYLFIIWFL